MLSQKQKLSERVRSPRCVYLGLASCLLLAALLAFPQPAGGSVRLIYMLQQRPVPIAWPDDAFPISYSFDRASLFHGERNGEIGRAVASWEDVQDTHVQFIASEGIGLRAGRDGQNVITAADGLFVNSGFLAFTTTWFDDEGRIFESDIQVDVAALGSTNFEALIQHEIGHLLGLDHSGNLASVMYPFIQDRPAPLPATDRLGIVTLYPTVAPQGSTLRGEVRSTSGPVLGAHVVVIGPAGEIVSTVLSDRDGRYEVKGLPYGTFQVYAEPLDGPVHARQMSGIHREAEIGFRTVRSSPVALTSAVHRVDLEVELLPPTLNPRWIGTVANGQVSLSSKRKTVEPGQLVELVVGGDGFISGSTKFAFSSPAVERISDFRYGSNYVSATFRIAATAPEGAVSAMVSSGGEEAALTGALWIERSSSTRRRPAR